MILLSEFYSTIPPKSTFQQRNKNFNLTPQARLTKATYRAILEKFRPPAPFDGPLHFRLVLTWPHTRQSRKAAEGHTAIAKTTRPDGVNILKMVEDIMTDLAFWHDDNQLSIETVERYYGDFPGILLQIESIE